MSIIPPTPFLPTSRHHFEEQTQLLEAEPVFDDTFDSWPSSPVVHTASSSTVQIPLISAKSTARDRHSSYNVNCGAGPSSRPSETRNVLSISGSLKRSGGDSPTRLQQCKRAKARTPIRDDFYTRRVKDSYRRSSLCPKLVADLNESSCLLRSTSQVSVPSRSSYRSVSREIRGTEIDSGRPVPAVLQDPTTIPDGSSRPDSHLPGDPSQYSTSAFLSDSSAPLDRSISRLSSGSTSRRISLSEKVTGFFSRLAGRASATCSADGGEAVPSASQLNVEEGDNDFRKAEYPPLESAHSGAAEPKGPKLRLPPPLTRPASRTLSTATRALQPKKTVESAQIVASIASRSKTSGVRNPPRMAPPKSRVTQLNHSHSRRTLVPKPPSTFTARALARLPAPGAGSSSASHPVTVRSTERALDLASKRETFERLAREAAEEKARARNTHSSSHIRPSTGLRKTIPVNGNTPGKASRKRAEERARFEEGLKQRHEEKEQRDEEIRIAREEMERAEDRVRRAETVVWAKGLPSIYQGRGPPEGH